jgi:hypothetical protein
LGWNTVAYADWETNGEREKDLTWRAKWLEKKRKIPDVNFPQERLDEIEKISPFIRLRPEEVAAAVSEPIETWPVPFQVCTTFAEKVLQTFSDEFSSPPDPSVSHGSHSIV